MSSSYIYAYRAQKSLGLVGFSPSEGTCLPHPGFSDPGVPARELSFSSNGLFSQILPDAVSIFNVKSGELVWELSESKGVIETHFSPKGTYLATWERPKKLDDPSEVHKNLRIFSTETGQEVFSLSQKNLGDSKEWDLQYTDDESYAVRLQSGGSGDIQIYVPANFANGIQDKAKVEGASSVHLSPGKNPNVAVFVKERKGAPASFKLFSLGSLMGGGSGVALLPICQKTFYKADRATVKWNGLGTQVLLLTQTDVDNSNKSYYGETGLYLLSAAGNFDARLTLDREGPIHDFAWSPGSKEFAVVYGYMPAKTTLFSTRLQSLYDFAPSPTNFVSFSPNARLLMLAGFGNLAGNIAVYERRDPSKQITRISAPNTTACEWSPDGKFLMTSTFSPRLRVDNMIKIWHLPSGQLCHVQETDELYAATWSPSTSTGTAATSPSLDTDAAPTPTDQASSFLSKSKSKSPSPDPTSAAAAKPAGAYRPPGARGTATPAIFRREDEGGYARLPENGGASGTSTPRGRRSPVGHGHGYGARLVPGAGDNGGGKRRVPGAAPSPNPGAPGAQGKGAKGGKGKKEKGGVKSPPMSPNATNGNVNGNGNRNGGGDKGSPGAIVAPAPVKPVAAETLNGSADAAAELDSVAKKARNLNKKLKAIEELKVRFAKGEKLEATQIRKMEGEEEIRKELAKLGV
ncbi:eukaryotic translation initiation factor eIF2A-domain-containing protein [Flagelloscypha sp. PMI_526]|nr:eukaryotic translation initiation factor eIF2A-domain-containing protein [Flagelloscypha sp. PMI_526]